MRSSTGLGAGHPRQLSGRSQPTRRRRVRSAALVIVFAVKEEVDVDPDSSGAHDHEVRVPAGRIRGSREERRHVLGLPHLPNPMGTPPSRKSVQAPAGVVCQMAKQGGREGPARASRRVGVAGPPAKARRRCPRSLVSTVPEVQPASAIGSKAGVAFPRLVSPVRTADGAAPAPDR
jgi:hypothetical protein